MIIGLTGGIASGKSTVSRMLQDLGAVIIDADLIAREVVQPQTETWFKIKEKFGENIFLPDGHLDRKKLGAMIFKDAQARVALNAIVHPAIRLRMKELKEEAIARGEKLIVLDIPLLFESELEYLVEKILVVYVPSAIQKERLMSRDEINEELALQKMSSQLSLEVKKQKGHAYIDNSGTLAETKSQLERIIQYWIEEEENEGKK